jgi:hypothetical protein
MIPAPIRRLFSRLLRPLGNLVARYSACTGRTESCLDTLKSIPPPAVIAKLFSGPDSPIPSVVRMPQKRT